MKNICKHFYILPILLGSLLLPSCGEPQNNEDGTVNIKMSVVWNGLSSMKPSNDPENTRIAKIIKEETGVNLKVNFVNGTENENLVRMFATGKNMPDCIMAPYWGGGDACSDTIRQAAKDGLLISLDDYLKDTTYLKDAYTTGVAQNFIDNELSASQFKGKKYIIPMHTPANQDEMQNWGYTVFCRKDILTSLDVDPKSINSSQKVYELAEQIQKANFKDINGNPIIPASCWGNGWSYETYLNSFKTRNFTEVVDKGDHFEWSADQTLVEEEVKFMQKMVSNNLFDKTAFSHSETQALSKHVVGGVGLTSAHYPYIKSALKNNLYKTNPEMEYVPLGPILNANGEAVMPSTTYEKTGYYGFAVIMVTKDCKNVDKLIEYLDFINSPKGQYLAYLGEENVDYTIDEFGKPHMTEEFFAQEEANSNYAYDNGIDTYFTFGVSRVPFTTFSLAREEEVDETYAAVKEMYPLKLVEGVRASSFDEQYKDIDYVQNILGAVSYKTSIESAYCANSQEEALNKLNTYRKSIHTRSYLDNYLTWLYELIGNRTDILF